MSDSADTRRRIIMLRAALAARRVMVHTAEELGISLEEYMAIMAVRLGELEERPMDISEVAVTTGQKFPSTHRHLKKLQQEGIILSFSEGKRVIHKLKPSDKSERLRKATAEIDKIMKTAASELQKL